MKYDIVPNSCRVCLQKTKRIRSIYKPGDDGDEAPYEMLKQLTGFDMDEESDSEYELPNNICKPCELSLNMAYQFRIKAVKMQQIIKLYCQQYLQKDQTIDIESSHPVFVVKEEFLEINESTDQNSLEEEPSIKVEKLDSPYNHLYVDEFGVNDKVEYLDELYLDVEDNDHIDVISSMQTSHIDEGLQTTMPKCDATEEHQNDILDTSVSKDGTDIRSSVRTASGRKKRQCIITKENATERAKKNVTGRLSSTCKKQNKVKPENYICDVCGNIYAKRSRMMEHRRRHNKELSYACELCDKKFNIREMLRKHMYMHSGGKPYKCSYCSRTFFYESVRRTHEAVHSGHKPYVCDQCNKAFAYSHALNKHKLIHAEIKLYHCQYCNKDFRLQHHMKQHLDTKTHQNAVRIAGEEGTQKTINSN